MHFLRTRPLLAFVLATLWVGWAVWANSPHYYDAQAMEREIAAVLGPNEDVELQPATAGFPFTFMRYDYSNNDQLTVYETEISTVLPNLLFCLAGVLGAALLVARTRHVSFRSIAVVCCFLAPAVVLYMLLNGPHPAVISYVYFTPLVLLLISLAVEMVRKHGEPNHGFHTEPRSGVIES